MKRAIVLMVVLTLCASGLASAESKYGYSGGWKIFEEYGFRVYLPVKWSNLTREGQYFAAGLEDESEYMSIHVKKNPGHEPEEILALLEESGLCQTVELIGNCVRYDLNGGNLFGAIAFTQDESALITFSFAPASDEMREIANQILCSLF